MFLLVAIATKVIRVKFDMHCFNQCTLHVYTKFSDLWYSHIFVYLHIFTSIWGVLHSVCGDVGELRHLVSIEVVEVGGECVCVWGGRLKGLGHNIMLTPSVALPALIFQHRQSNIFQFLRLSEFLPLQIHVTFN